MSVLKKGNRVLVSFVIAGLLCSTGVQAGQGKHKKEDSLAAAKVEKQVKSDARKEVEIKRQTIVREAVMALDQTGKAIEALKNKKKQEALDSLAMAAGKLEIVLAREPEMANAPIDVRVEEFDLYASADTINKAVKSAEGLLEDGEVQQARAILADLASEIDLVITSLPLAAYTDTIKNVAKLVDAEKYEEATQSLYELLSTMVITRNVIPLPLLRAEMLLEKADKLVVKKDRSEKENDELKTLLDDAENQIDMAEALGYGRKDDFKSFYAQIKEIRKKTRDGKFGSGFVDGLKNSLRKLKEKIFNGPVVEDI
ncbi:YfdX family protein [Desulfomarina sp.]